MKRLRFLIVIGLVGVMAAFSGGVDPCRAQVPTPRESGIPDYFNTPNWANSPPLHKFVDSLPGLYVSGVTPVDSVKNNLGQYIPVAVPDKTTYDGSDYYEIELGKFKEQMHSDLPGPSNLPPVPAVTQLLGYRQTNTGDVNVSLFHYLGPLIIAQKDRPVRIKFTNALGTGADGDLFIPVDTSIMGAGEFDIDYDPETKLPIAPAFGVFTQNRADLHLHGGRNPWISDGTPHQWITPLGEVTDYPKGVSVAYVPDMWFDAAGNTITACAGQTSCAVAGATNNPGPGSQTYYWTNQQSARLMFFHDHAWGITRLNVYVGEAAGYLLTDDTETALKTAGVIPPDADQVPLIIQDKTFVDATTILNTDPTWIWGSIPGTVSPWDSTTATPVTGDLWWPHVYMPAQNPFNPDMSGVNAMGRWHYGPWFWPPTNNIPYGPVANPYYDMNCDPAVAAFCQPPEIPGTPNPSWGAEAFLDTPVVNGTAYPKLAVDPKPYRFRILNAAHDRFFNLQLYVAADKNTTNAVDPTATSPILCDGTQGPGVLQTDCTEVKMVPAVVTPGFPATWPTDGRAGGVPDPATAGPSWIQIGTEGGFLPEPVVIENQPITWNLDPTMFNVGNVDGGTLIIGPAERADVIIDFSLYAEKTLILYNDSPAPFPALDPHYDYYTGDPDNTGMGGAPTTPPGLGPNTRTIMQIQVAGGVGTPFDLPALQTAFVPAGGAPGIFKQGQEPIIVGQSAYNDAYNTTFPATWPYWGVSRITDNAISFQRADGTPVNSFPMEPKAIQDEMGEVFDDYGRMSAKLGLELPFTTAGIQTFVLQNFVDPPTEIVADNEVQIWKITHNGVDTHPVHFHLFEVQLLNRVGWDGFIRLPDANELGWKDTVRISPLEDTIVALRPSPPRPAFALPDSIRPLNPAFPLGSSVGFTNLDPLTAQPITPPVVNALHNFGWEYVWHCHILSHEESDMMRPLVFNPKAQTEILWRHAVSGDNAVWHMDGTRLAGSEPFQAVPDTNWAIVGTGDFNNDGKSDILWRHASGTNVVWYMDGMTYIGWAFLPAVPDPNWKIVGTGDFNNDGKPDLLWRHATGLNVVWYMDGVNYVIFAFLPAVPDSNWKIVGTGDFNNDGKPDILWRHATGLNVVWYMNGVNYVSFAFVNPEADATWEIVGIGDFNSDINPDILWRNSTTGANRVWFLDGVTYLGSATLTAEGDVGWKIVGR